MEKKGLQKTISNNIFIAKYLFKYVPFYAVFKIVMQILNALIGVLTYTYSLKYIIDSVQQQKAFEEVLLMLILLGLANLVIRLIDAALEYVVTPVARERLKQKLQLELFEKAVTMDLDCYDNPEFYNDFILAASQAEDQCFEIYNTMMELLNLFIAILSLGAIIISVNYLGIILALFTAVTTLINNVRLNQTRNQKYLEIKPLERKGEYVKRVFYLADYAKEMRLYDLKDKMSEIYTDSSQETKKVLKKYGNKLSFYGFVSEYVLNDFVMFTVFMLVLLYQTVILKTVTYGAFATMFYAATQLKDRLISLSGIFAKFQANSLYIEYFRRFVSYSPKVVERPNSKEPLKEGAISLLQVEFKYRKEQNSIIDNISMKIAPGEKVAIIGYNGSGKTTLIKLILRLYDVTKGEVRLGERNIKEYQLKPYRNLFAAVFQDYQVYAASIASNVTMDRYSGTKEEEEKVKQALKESGVLEVMGKYPDGILTPVTKEFDVKGALFSGGEEQKLAISRVFYKDCPYIILDEPSSALDPIAEYNLNQTIKSALQDKTIIFITHRLSTSRIADKIFMMEEGRIIEEGTHESLMELGGKYARMFQVQADKYL
jgi:ATP-binding cassette subfamily B protein